MSHCTLTFFAPGGKYVKKGQSLSVVLRSTPKRKLRDLEGTRLFDVGLYIRTPKLARFLPRVSIVVPFFG